MTLSGKAKAAKARARTATDNGEPPGHPWHVTRAKEWDTHGDFVPRRRTRQPKGERSATFARGSDTSRVLERQGVAASLPSQWRAKVREKAKEKARANSVHSTRVMDLTAIGR